MNWNIPDVTENFNTKKECFLKSGLYAISEKNSRVESIKLTVIEC